MFAAWSLCAILFATVFGARAAPLEDDPLVEKVKEIIADVDNYLASNDLTELRIPNIDFSLSPIKIRNGGFGDFSTIVLQDDASVKETKLEDNSTLYLFNVNVGLEELRFHYDFVFDAIVLRQAGNFSLSVSDNSAKLTGFVLVAKDSSCKAILATARVLSYDKYAIHVEPNDFPQVTKLSEEVLDFITPYILPFSNTALQASLLVPKVQQIFAEFACKKITSS